MADSFAKNPEREEEKIHGREGAEKHAQAEKHGAKEIKQTSREFVEGVSEVVEGSEVAETAEGNVAEEERKGKNKFPAGGMPGGSVAGKFGADEKAEIPPIEVMQSQIATMIRKEIRILEKEAKQIMFSSKKFSPFKLNGIISKIRMLKDILANLGYAAAETVKGWWMKFVKGITT